MTNEANCCVACERAVPLDEGGLCRTCRALKALDARAAAGEDLDDLAEEAAPLVNQLGNPYWQRAMDYFTELFRPATAPDKE